jgi:hypothetical protein
MMMYILEIPWYRSGWKTRCQLVIGIIVARRRKRQQKLQFATNSRDSIIHATTNKKRIEEKLMSLLIHYE